MNEAATGNKVEDGSAVSNEGWKAKVLADFETGSEPDVLFFFTNADADPIINAGRVISIEDIREVYPDYASNMKQSMLAEAADGKHYAVPAAGYWENLFVNKSVLEACGVSVPGADYTWEQFLSDCETIKGSGYIPIACSLVEVPHYLFEFAVMNNGTVENHLEVPTLDENGNLQDDEVSRKWVAALNDIKELYDLGYFPPNTLTATDEETVSLFGNGKAAFLVDGSWQVGHLGELYGDKIEDMAVRFVPAKGERKATEGIGGISMGYFITRKAWKDPEKRDAAVQFVEMLTSNEILSTGADRGRKSRRPEQSGAVRGGDQRPADRGQPRGAGRHQRGGQEHPLYQYSEGGHRPDDRRKGGGDCHPEKRIGFLHVKNPVTVDTVTG